MTPSTMTTATAPLPRARFDARIARLGARQGNTFSRAQVLELGATDPMIQRRVRSGRWERPFPGVYSIAGLPPSWSTLVWAAYLAVGPGAVVTHETALHLHGVHALPRSPVTLTVPHGRHLRLPGVVVHQVDDLRPTRVATLSGLPVSTPERTVVDLAPWLGARQLGDVMDDLVSARRCSYPAVAACLAEVARPRKPGVRKLARVLDQRLAGHVPPQSELERALFLALEAGGLPEPRRQFRLPGRGAIDGVVDAAYPMVRVLLEADGRRWHTRIRDLRTDHLRDTEAARVGWLTLRFVYEQIVHGPDEVCAAVADVLAVRSRPWEKAG